MNPLYETLEYDDYLTPFLQKNVKIILNDRVIRQGQLVLYKYKNYLIQLFFKTNNNSKLRKTELPIPFKIIEKDNKLIFSYYPEDLFPRSFKLPDTKNSKNKFLNNRLTIEEK